MITSVTSSSAESLWKHPEVMKIRCCPHTLKWRRSAYTVSYYTSVCSIITVCTVVSSTAAASGSTPPQTFKQEVLLSNVEQDRNTLRTQAATIQTFWMESGSVWRSRSQQPGESRHERSLKLSSETHFPPSTHTHTHRSAVIPSSSSSLHSRISSSSPETLQETFYFYFLINGSLALLALPIENEWEPG